MDLSTVGQTRGQTNGPTGGRTDRRTVGRTVGRMDGWTDRTWFPDCIELGNYSECLLYYISGMSFDVFS